MQTNNLLPTEAIEEFKVIYFKRFGKKLTQEEAEQQALQLFYLYDAVYGKRITHRS